MRRTAIPLLRLALTGGLLFFAYGETGPWTTLILTLLAIAIEMNSLVLGHRLSVTNTLRVGAVEAQFHGEGERRAVLDALRSARQ